ncbi:MAG: SMC-Scp complex subunit ScpB [Thermoplasmataceae archaeon]
MNQTLKVEAVLYASNKPLTVRDISGVLSIPAKEVSKEIKKLLREYDKGETSITIVKIGNRYRMQLREDYLDIVNAVSEPELTNLELSVMGFIAANPSCRRGDLRDKFGDRYAIPLERLKDMKLVHSKRYRNTEILTTGKKFFEYFGIDRTSLEKMLGKKSKQGIGSEFNE